MPLKLYIDIRRYKHVLGNFFLNRVEFLTVVSNFHREYHNNTVQTSGTDKLACQLHHDL